MANQLRLDVAQLTDVGRKREHNEDNMAYVIPKDVQVMTKKGALFIVADGMGGHAAGEVASEIAVDTVSNAYYQDDDEDVPSSLLQAIKRANALIHQRAAENMLRSGMGTTCVAAVLRGNMAYIANVGDSRAYFLRNGQVKQISQDHSWVAEQVRAGLLTDDQARTHAQRNVITRCLGTQADVDIDVFTQELQEGDSFVLCTDGLSGLVSDDEIRRIVDQHVPQESVYHLIEQANNNGGPDNITAIVLRVLEVGEEPPGVRHPVGVGGRETGEDTAILGIPGAQSAMAQRPIDGHVPSAPLRYSSGPLSPLAESVTAPQPVSASLARRTRLLYPTLAICILLIVALVGTGAFYFLRPRTDAAAQSIQDARSLIARAQGESQRNAVSALQDLSHAQNMLRGLQSSTLSGDQQTAVSSLQADLVGAVKNAITDYNQQSAISNLPCTTQPLVNTVNEGSTNAQPLSLATVQGNKGTIFYTRASDNGLYQISSQYGLVNHLALQSGLQVLSITGDNNHLFLLMAPLSGNRNQYKLGLLLPGQSTLSSSQPLATTFQNEQLQPTLMTAWGNDLYVVLSPIATPSNNASNIVILDYTVSSNNKLSTSPSRTTTIATSTTVTSVAAFPGRQLFLLSQDGTVQNLQLNVKNAVPTSVLVQHPLATPLSVTADAFNAETTVPTVTASTSAPSENVPLIVNGALQLTTGAVSGQNQPHLYVVDPTNHRLLDLQISSSSLSSPTPTPTPTSTATTTASNGNGGSVAGGSSIIVTLNRQYVSTSLFANLTSVVTDPKGLPIYALSKSSGASPSTLLISLDTNACV